MSAMTSIGCRQGRVPSASMMLSILRTSEETADMSALEYYENLIREKRILHMPKDANGAVVEDDNGNSTFRCAVAPRTPGSLLPVIDSNDENLMELLD